mmetsp:Transcript_19619/g.57182  ORF Transcript_19619/g.57182 Transcript_19619/m.57182 type:complete len:253 (+) Transcript_19619:653-1411(+)
MLTGVQLRLRRRLHSAHDGCRGRARAGGCCSDGTRRGPHGHELLRADGAPPRRDAWPGGGRRGALAAAARQRPRGHGRRHARRGGLGPRRDAGVCGRREGLACRRERRGSPRLARGLAALRRPARARGGRRGARGGLRRSMDGRGRAHGVVHSGGRGLSVGADRPPPRAALPGGDAQADIQGTRGGRGSGNPRRAREARRPRGASAGLGAAAAAGLPGLRCELKRGAVYSRRVASFGAEAAARQMKSPGPQR